MSGGLLLSLGTMLLTAELTVGVPPFFVLGLDESQRDELRRATIERLSTQRGRELIESADVDSAIAGAALEGEALRTCLEDGPCSARIARSAGANTLLVGSAAGLGNTYMLRLTLVDARRSVIDREVQTTVEGTFPELVAALDEQINSVLPPPRAPFYRRWWFWTTMVTVVAAAVVIPTVILTRPQDGIDTYPFP